MMRIGWKGGVLLDDPGSEVIGVMEGTHKTTKRTTGLSGGREAVLVRVGNPDRNKEEKQEGAD